MREIPFRILPIEFYQQDTIDLAIQLIGTRIIRYIPAQDMFLSGFIVETEAYLGTHDLASHARGGLRTKRNASMYLDAGHAYVYFVYGMHWCFNVVTATRDNPEAILIRAVEPETGIDWMKKRRKKNGLIAEKDVANGPAKLCQAFDISKNQDGLLLTGTTLGLAEGRPTAAEDIATTPRIGIDYAGDHAFLPLRFVLRNSNFVSST